VVQAVLSLLLELQVQEDLKAQVNLHSLMVALAAVAVVQHQRARALTVVKVQSAVEVVAVVQCSQVPQAALVEAVVRGK
jgi:hypothetical protein